MSLLSRIFGFGAPPAPPSGDVAKERLKLVLEYDRARLTAAQLDEIRDEIIESISRRVAIERDDVEIKLQRDGKLVAEIPLDKGARGVPVP